MPPWITATADGVLLSIRVIPRAGQSAIAGTRDDALLVRLKAAPVDGAANAELIELIAAACAVPKRSVTIAAGVRSRRKRVSIAGLSPTQATAILHVNGAE